LHMASESSAQRFRLLLYATSVLLALALIDLGRRLRARAERCEGGRRSSI
jgi:hypothetical protein